MSSKRDKFWYAVATVSAVLNIAALLVVGVGGLIFDVRWSQPVMFAPIVSLMLLSPLYKRMQG